MSQRAKRPNRSDDGSVPVKRRKRTAAEEEEAASLAAAWQPRSNDLKSIYNRTTTEAPAELFRKDLISAMKLPDSEPLASNEYWVIVDQWKQEWERGVQVPVNPDSLPEPSVTVTHCTPIKLQHEFKLPKNKYIRITKDENFKIEDHALSNAPAQAEAACSYDLDECDVSWLKILNSERAMCGQSPVYEDQLERVIEQFELSCWDKIQSILRNEEGLGIEYDENVICDVCRSPDSEEGNEMVFCDSCNICVHQACYGITRIPEGQWLCCTCNLSKRPKCVLCPNKGGAMKCTRSGQKWAHVSCALWIPEVSIGCVEKMEPITKISSIPGSRWALICVLCRERVGACIQCSVKTCKTAYHVTCAFKHGLEMRAIIEDENADDGVKLRSYCEKHSKSSKKEKSVCSGSEDDDSKRKKRKDMTSEEKNQARAARLQEIEAEFYKHVSIKDVSIHLDVDNDALHYIYNYWKLKRKAGNNKPLLPPKSEDVDMLSHKREQADLEKMKMFVQLRQDLERVRNLCYMVSRREKLSRSFFRLREQTFHKQAAVLESAPNLPNVVVQAVIEANHGPSIYDRLYSHKDAEDHTTDFDTILSRIAGIKSPTESGDEKKPELNGLFKDVKNPYKKVYFNGTSKRRSGSLYGSSTSSSSDERPKDNENRLHPTSSEEEEKPSVSSLNKKKPTIARKTNNNNNKAAVDGRRKRHSASSRSKVESSSEEDAKQKTKKNWGFSRSRLMQVEHELGCSGSDSDELMPIHSTQKTDTKKMSSIYSDSDSSDVSMKNDDKSSNAASDSQQNRLRTKAAVKEFSHKPSTSKSPNKSSPDNKKKNKPEIGKKENAVKKKDYVPSDLIVPQRQAAKKATENLKSTTSNRIMKEQILIEEPPKTESDKLKTQKPKTKTVKDVNKELSKKDTNKQSDIFDIDKEMDKLDNQEILAYVPQRQAAKKAAEHIKSGLGKPVAPTLASSTEQMVDNEKPKKDGEVGKTKKEIEKPARVAESKRKSSSNSSSSSSSSSSSDSSTSSSSDSDDEPSTQKPPPPPTSTQQQPRSESLFSNQSREMAKRTNAKDWPFLDKGAKPAASSSSSDSSDSSRPSSPTTKLTTQQQQAKTTDKTIRKSPDKKQLPSQREEQTRLRGKGRPARGRPRPSKSGDRLGDANVRTRDLPDSQRGDVERERNKFRKGKPDEMADKETIKSSKLQSPIRKTDKKLIESKPEGEISNLEREILERKAGKQGSSKTKSTLDRLFGPPDKKIEREDKNKLPNKVTKPAKPEKQLKSTVKENKEPILEKITSPLKKSPVKSKSIDDVFTQKSISNENKIELKDKLTPKREEVVASFSDNAITDSNKITQEVFNSNSEKLQNDIDSSEKKSPLKQNQEYQNRSIFSPPHVKDNLLDFDNLDDGFGIPKDEEIMKGPLTFSFGNTSLFKEDSKEDSARETLNLVEKLRMELSKKSTSCDVDDGASVSSSTKNESDRTEFSEQVVPNSVTEAAIHKNEPKSEEVATVNLEMRVEVTETSSKTFEERNQQQDYRYLSCEADVPLEQNKNIPIQQHHGLPDHGISAQGDERWVPPSDAYSSMPPIDSSNYGGERAPHQTPQHYMQQYSNQTHHKNSLPPQVDIRMHEETVKNQSPSIHDRRISQTPLNDPASMDCMPSPSPYTDMHPQAKWADSEIMPNRRSSSSSAASSSSSCSRRNDEDEIKMRQDVMMVNHPSLENIAYLPPQGIPFAPNSIEPFSAFSETSQFVSPVSLFPPPSLNTPLAFPSTGPAMFPPAFGAPFPAPHSVMPTLPKPVNENMQYSSTCTATFTSSQHNMALTAAMVNLPPSIPKDLESPPDEEIPTPTITEPISTTQTVPEEVPPSPVISNSTPNASNVLSSPSPSIKSNSSAGKKSPSKPTRTSARVTSQLNKSPNKSPGKSPRQEIVKPSIARGRGDTRRNSVKTNASRGSQGQLRGRGRGRGRGRSHSQHNDYEFSGTNTIHNKLVGTVYDLDFDDDISNDNMTDLKSMRERRKSVDIHDRKTEIALASKDNSPSPKFASPSQTSHKSTRSYNADLRDLRPPTPVEDSRPKTTEAAPVENERPPIFPDMVQPVLPGPVDMRTYSSNFDQQTYNEANLLSAFATGTTETQVHEEIDEDFEKELQTALTTTNKKPEEPPTPEVGNIKVSLSDSRNQLKVKIKGPIANYSSTIAPLPQPTVDPVVVSNMNFVSNNVISNNSIGVSSGTSNLRRMRKKELLRQYWTQDMNMDDSSCAPGFNATPTVPPVNRTIITIPKAVASMTSIPTKDDYRDYRTGSDDIIETKQHRKETKCRPGALTRELRQLDLPLDEDGILERRRSVGSVGSNNSSLSTSYESSLTNKRRGRPPRPSQQPSTTPKIKIKIGNSIVGGSAKIDDKKDRIRPPKKRLATINLPSVEDLKRESMKFRKLVMADFGEGKEKRKKKDKSEKRKRKKSKPEVQIISNESQNPTKLIIRIGKKVDGESENKRTSGGNENCNNSSVTVSTEPSGSSGDTPKKSDETTCDNGEPKMTPIKLKLSRCQEGSGYVMKRSTPTQQPPSAETKAEETTQPGQPPPSPLPPKPSPPTSISLPDGVHAPTPLPLNKDCEVR